MPLTIVFDLDGTLIDTAPDLVDTLNVILQRAGFEPLAFDKARELIGFGARTMLERGISVQGRALAHDELDRLFADYLVHYADHIADRSRPFPGLIEALDELAQSGCRFAVCTNKLEWLSRRLLERLQLTHRFVAICGQDTFKIAKPNPEMLVRTIAAAEGDIARAVMIGDSATDISTARAAGIPVIAVDFGYTDVPVTELGPDRVIGRFDELPKVLRNLVPGWD